MLKSLDRICVGEGASLKEALQAIDRGGCEIALVVDGTNHLLGLLTDGDVRRAILSGGTLEAPIQSYVQRRFASVRPDAGRVEVLDLMRARGFSQVPVIDQHGHLVGLHLIREMLGVIERPNWAVIMAGGRGERLRPLTDSLPKPMIKVAGRPILERLVLHLVGYGIRRVFIAVNYMAEVIERHFGDGGAHGCRIEYLRETKPLGTGGALSLLPETPADPVLVLNGDLLTQCDLARMLAFHTDGAHKVTVGVHEYMHTVPYGVVETQGSRITALQEKPTMTWLANAGLYVIEPELFSRIPKKVEFPLPALVEECLDRGESVGAFPIEEDWMDVGQPRDLTRANGTRTEQ